MDRVLWATIQSASAGQYRRAKKSCKREFLPPISSIGRSGKRWVRFESYRQDGRLVLRQVRVPAQGSLYACREDGRLRICLVQPDDYYLQPEEEEEKVVGEEEEDEEVIEEEKDPSGA
ncbi:hypothetical protein Dimus_020002 [Dionaea muscipula]